MSAPIPDKSISPEPMKAYGLPEPLPPASDGRKRWTRSDCEFLWNAGAPLCASEQPVRAGDLLP